MPLSWHSSAHDGKQGRGGFETRNVKRRVLAGKGSLPFRLWNRKVGHAVRFVAWQNQGNVFGGILLGQRFEQTPSNEASMLSARHDAPPLLIPCVFSGHGAAWQFRSR